MTATFRKTKMTYFNKAVEIQTPEPFETGLHSLARKCFHSLRRCSHNGFTGTFDKTAHSDLAIRCAVRQQVLLK